MDDHSETPGAAHGVPQAGQRDPEFAQQVSRDLKASPRAERGDEPNAPAAEQDRPRELGQPYRLLGESHAMAVLLKAIDKASRMKRVLVQGERGTGKEGVANEIHRRSGRQKKVVFNCANLSNENIADSQLLGSVKGAFTGAVGMKGFFEEADRGTVFVDEIGALPLVVQAKFLRVLQEGEIIAVGATRPRLVRVVVIAMTNKDLRAMVAAGTFMSDLYDRLAKTVVRVPPLSARREDIPLLASHFIAQSAIELGRSHIKVEKDGFRLLLRASFPGNVRELESLMEELVADMPEGCTELTCKLMTRILAQRGLVTAERRKIEHLDVQMDRTAREAIISALKATDGHREKAAGLLGIARSSLLHNMQRLGLSVGARRAPRKAREED